MPEHRGGASLAQLATIQPRCRRRRHAKRGWECSLGHLVCQGPGLVVGWAMLTAGCSGAGPCRLAGKRASNRSIRSGQREEVAQHAFAAQQGGNTASGTVSSLRPIPWGMDSITPSRERCSPRTPGRLLPGHALQRQQFHQPAAPRRSGPREEGAAPVRAAVSSRPPSGTAFQPQQHHGLAEGGDLRFSPNPRADGAHEGLNARPASFFSTFNIVGTSFVCAPGDEVDDAACVD